MNAQMNMDQELGISYAIKMIAVIRAIPWNGNITAHGTFGRLSTIHLDGYECN